MKQEIIQYTKLSNNFIDNHMSTANGEFVKVYILLTRNLATTTAAITPQLVSDIADQLKSTEKDVLRAIDYWKQSGVITDPSFHNNAVSINSAEDVRDFKELMYYITKQFGKKLDLDDTNTLYYIYYEIGLEKMLLKYLIDYCVSKDKCNMKYIKKIAENWKDNQITTVQQAKDTLNEHYFTCYKVFNVFKISGRHPAAFEVQYCEKWEKEYGFSVEMIMEACRRTLETIHKPSFRYCDGILKKWHNNNIDTLEALATFATASNKNSNNKSKESLLELERLLLQAN